MEVDKGASIVPRYMSTAGGTSAEVSLDNLTALKAVQKWSDAQTLEAALLALHGVAGTCHSAGGFLGGFPSAVESIKLFSNLRQGPSEKVVDHVRSIIMTFRKDRKVRYQAADKEQQKAGYHECLINMIKMHFVGGLRPSIRQVLMSHSQVKRPHHLQSSLEVEKIPLQYQSVVGQTRHLSQHSVLSSLHLTHSRLKRLDISTPTPISMALANCLLLRDKALG